MIGSDPQGSLGDALHFGKIQEMPTGSECKGS